MYRLSTTNYSVIRMRCGIRDTVGRKLDNEKGLREGWDFEKIVKICGRVKNGTLKNRGVRHPLKKQELRQKRMGG